jgi:hypothetical protein
MFGNKLLAIFIAVHVLLGAAVGQSLSEGSVVGLQIEPNPQNSTFVYDFELCCGFPSGNGGFFSNGFGYADREFSLFYKYPGATAGYTFSGSVKNWFTPQAIGDCTLQSGTLDDGQIAVGTKIIGEGLTAEYSQLFCQRDGVYWLGPGGLTVHTQ